MRLASIVDSGGLRLFARISTAAAFEDLRIRSHADDCIALQTALPDFVKALKSGLNTESVAVRLTKQGEGVYLKVEVKTLAGTRIDHYVPVEVRSAIDNAVLEEPAISTPEVRLEMPDVHTMRNVVDRMRTVDKMLHVLADMQSGSVTLGVSNEAVSVKTFFKGLAPQAVTVPDGLPAGASAKPTLVKISVHELMRVLSSVQLLNASMILCISRGQAFILHLILVDELGTMTFYLPVSEVDDGDEAEAEADAVVEVDEEGVPPSLPAETPPLQPHDDAAGDSDEGGVVVHADEGDTLGSFPADSLSASARKRGRGRVDAARKRAKWAEQPMPAATSRKRHSDARTPRSSNLGRGASASASGGGGGGGAGAGAGVAAGVASSEDEGEIVYDAGGHAGRRRGSTSASRAPAPRRRRSTRNSTVSAGGGDGDSGGGSPTY